MSVAVAIGSIVLADPSNGLDSTRTAYVVVGTLTLSGNYGGGATNGDTVNFASPFIQSDYPPRWVTIEENQGAGQAPLGFNYIYNNGTTIANGVLSITGGAAVAGQGGAQITQGNAYSSFTPSLNNVVLRFRAEFLKNI